LKNSTQQEIVLQRSGILIDGGNSGGSLLIERRIVDQLPDGALSVFILPVMTD